MGSERKSNLPDEKRVVITGLGVVSSIGIGWQEFWKNLLAGKSGISKVDYVNTENYERHYAGEIKNFETDAVRRRYRSQMGKSSLYALDAVDQALMDANLTPKDFSDNSGCISIGTTMGEAQAIEALVMGEIATPSSEPEALLALTYPANSISTSLARNLKSNRRSILFANACAAGNYAVGYGYDQIVNEKARFVVTGGVDALSRIAFTGFSRLFAMAPEICQPFDRDRQGMMLGEGAGIIILESLASAKTRDVKVYAEILGYGLSCDARHMTNPSTIGVAKAIRKSLIASNVSPNDIKYVCAHGTGTPENDRAESEAISNVFGREKVPVSSIKSMLGHTMGAASAIETIACALTLTEGNIPPTINLRNLDSACSIDCVENSMRRSEVDLLVNNSQAFGGNNAVLVMGRI